MPYLYIIRNAQNNATMNSNFLQSNIEKAYIQSFKMMNQNIDRLKNDDIDPISARSATNNVESFKMQMTQAAEYLTKDFGLSKEDLNALCS